MMLPDFAAYICLRHALVVKKAPSRWIARRRFQSANGNSTTGVTIWMPALLTSTSMRPYFAIVSATPFSTDASSATFIPTAKAAKPFDVISRAVASAASILRSAMTGVPPESAKRSAIALPMPLAAPVMMAVFPSKRGIAIPFGANSRFTEVIEDDFAETERQIGDIVHCRDHLAYRQSGDVAEGVVEQLNGARTTPRTLYRDVFHVIAHQFADPRRAVDMRDDLDHEVRPSQCLHEHRLIDLAMLEAHCRRDAQHRTVAQGAHNGVAFMRHLRARQLFRKTPDLPSASDRRI